MIEHNSCLVIAFPLKGVKIDAETKQHIETEESKAFKEVFGWKKRAAIVSRERSSNVPGTVGFV